MKATGPQVCKRRRKARFRPSAVVRTALALTLAVPSALAQERVNPDAAREQLRESQRNLEDARSQEKEIKGDLQRLEKERAALNTKLIDTASRIQATETRLSQIEERVATLSREENKVRASIAERHGVIARMLGAMQRMGRQPPPALVTRRDDALKMVRSAMLMASVFPELKGQADALKAELDDLVRLGELIKRERDDLKTENEKLIADRDRIDGLIAEKKQLQHARQERLARIRKAAERHAKTVKYLGELVERMDKELAAAGLAAYEAELAAKRKREREAERQRQARLEAQQEQAEQQSQPEQRAQQESETRPRETKVAFLNPGRLKPAMEFPDTRGKLSLPVSGRQVRSFGSENEIGETFKGMSIASRAKAQVTSPVDGWVAFADEFRTYGQLLIINAGGGYHILLAGMERIDVDVGQFVLAGEPVAVMGASGESPGPGSNGQGPVLYVEFREDGRPIDPSPWWAKSPERVEG